jgi:hypothetical protein
MATTGKFSSHWLISKKIFSYETARPNEPNLVGRILDRPSVEITLFDAIAIKHGRPQTFFF